MAEERPTNRVIIMLPIKENLSRFDVIEWRMEI